VSVCLSLCLVVSLPFYTARQGSLSPSCEDSCEDVSVSLCHLCVSVSLCLCMARHAHSHPLEDMSLCLCVSFSLCLCVSVSPCLRVSVSPCLCVCRLSLCLFYMSICLSVSRCGSGCKNVDFNAISHEMSHVACHVNE